MNWLFNAKYTDDEKQYFEHIKNVLLSIDFPQGEVEKTTKKILSDAITRADKAGLRGVKTLGNKAIQDERFLTKRMKAGLTREDILTFLNRDYVLIVVENLLADAHRFSIYTTLVENGKSSGEAVKFLRKTFAYFDDPERSHQNYQGEDADIYPEFTLRYEKWRCNTLPIDVLNLAKAYSTYNAMVRDLIRKGAI